MTLNTIKTTFATLCLVLWAVVASATALTISGTQTSPSCVGSCDGTITLTVTGGTQPYSFVWSNGATTSALTGLCAGTYTVTVTDAVGATKAQTRIIRNPYAVRSNNTITNVSCNGACNGSITAAPYGGTGPYTIVWSNGQTGTTASSLCPGTYYFTVTDSHGCTYVCNEKVTEPTALVAGKYSSNATCAGNCDGSASVSASGGTAPYMYNWSNGATTDAVSGLCAGNYVCTITDANGCTNVQTVTITENAALVPSCSVIANESYAGATDGSMTASATGGVAPYHFNWSNGATTATINGLSAGSYTVTISDDAGCSATSSCTITAPQNCGGFRTQTQGGWGQCQQTGNNPGTYLYNNFSTYFPNGLTVGCGFTLKLTSSQAVCAFLPSGSTPRKLTANLVNPLNYNNVLAGQVVALTLNVTFDAMDPNFASSGTNLGNQVIVSGTFQGWSVQQLLDTANAVLGGCASNYSASTINNAVSAVNQNYVDGTTDAGYLACPGAGNRFSNSVSNIAAQVFPNPFNAEVNIRIPEERSATITMMDLSGKVMQVYTVNGGMLTISEQIKPGAYLLTIDYNDGAREVVKILKTN